MSEGSGKIDLLSFVVRKVGQQEQSYWHRSTVSTISEDKVTWEASIPGVTGLLHQPTGQVIDGSLRFDSGEKNYLTRISGAAGSGTTFTFSTWTRGTGDGTFFCNGDILLATTDFIL